MCECLRKRCVGIFDVDVVHDGHRRKSLTARAGHKGSRPDTKTAICDSSIGHYRPAELLRVKHSLEEVHKPVYVVDHDVGEHRTVTFWDIHALLAATSFS